MATGRMTTCATCRRRCSSAGRPVTQSLATRSFSRARESPSRRSAPTLRRKSIARRSGRWTNLCPTPAMRRAACSRTRTPSLETQRPPGRAGRPRMPELTYLQAISDGLREDVGAFGGAFKITEGFIDEFGPERVWDTPLAESGIIGTAVGAAVEGLRPVCEMQFADFISCGFDQLVNVAAKLHYRQ